MKPAPFAYRAPDQLEEALALLADHGGEAKVLAGGQSLIPMMSFRLAQPAMLVDCNHIAALDFIRASADGGLAVGALTRQRRLERDPLVARLAPLLSAALPWVAHPQIRTRGTFGGSLAHADPAAELPAIAVALDARLRLLRKGGERWVGARDFFVSLLTTALAEGELLVEVALPPQAPGTGWAFDETARRHGDYALAGVAALVRLDGEGRCAAARLVFLSAGDVPVDAGAARGLIGRVVDEAACAEVANAAGEQIEPSGDIHASADFKRHLARVLARRVLLQAAARAAAERRRTEA